MKTIPDNLLPTLEITVKNSIAGYEQMAQMSDEQIAEFIAYMMNNEMMKEMLESKSAQEVIQDMKVKELISGTKISAKKMLDDLLEIDKILQQ